MADAKFGIRLALEGADQVRGSLAGVEQGLERLNSGLAKVGHYGTALLALPTVFNGTVGAAVKAADAVTTLNNQLRLATGSTQAAGQAYTALFDIAQRSRVSFTELGSTFAAISRAGQELGISQTRLLTVTEAIGNAMTVSGGSAQSMQAALLQLSQGIASGTLRGEELNSVMEQTPRLAKALADGLGVTTGKLRELGAAGQITAEQVIRALEGQAAVLRGEVQGAVLTVGQAFVQLENATIKAVGEFDKASGLSNTLAQAMSGLAGGIDSAGKAFADNEAAIKTTLGLLAGAGVAVGLARTATALGGVATGVGGVAGAVAALKVVVGGLNPLTLALLGAGAVIGAAAGYESYFKGTQEGIRKTIADLEEANVKAGESLGRMQNRPEITNAVNKAIADRAKQIQILRAELAALDARNAPAGSVGSGDTALARAQVAENAKLAASFDDLRTRLSGFRGDYAKYQADLKAIQDGMQRYRDTAGAAGIPEREGIAMLTELAKKHGEVAKAVGSRNTSEKDAHDAAMERRKLFMLQQDDYEKALEAERQAIERSESASAKAEQSRIDAADKSASGVQARLQALKDEESALVIAAAQNISLAQAIEEVEIARLREQQSALMREGDRDSEVLSIQAEIDARKKLKAAIGGREARDAARQGAKDAESEWKRASEEIERSLTDALMRGFESGKGFAEVLRDTVVNMFKTMVLRPVIQATVQGGLNAVGLGSFGGQGAGSNLLGSAASNYVTSTLGSAVFGNSAAYGAALGTTSIGAGSQAAMLAAQTGEFGLAGLSATSGAAGGAMASIGAAMPYIGAALAVVSLLKSLDDSGTLHTGGLGSYSAAGGTAVGDAVKGQGLSFNLSNESYNASTQQASTQMAQAIVGLLDSTAKTFGQEAGYWAATGFADDTSKDGAWGALAIKMGDTLLADWKNGADKWPGREFADGEAGAREYAAAVALDVRNLLIEQTPDWADTMLRALGDAPTIEQLAATVGQINAAASALDAMGQASQAFATLGENAAGALITALGGAEAAVASLSGYYGNFYTETERAGIATASLTKQLGELGVALPTSRDAFRALVDQALEAGNPTLAANLVSLSDEFAALVPATQAAAAAVADTTDTMLASAAELERQQQQQAQAIKELAQQAADAARQSAATMLGALEQANQFFDGFQRSITSFVAGLDAQAGGLPGLRSAGAAYSSQLAFARGGDQDALQGITGYAQTYIDAIRRESTTAAEAALQVGRVRGQLLALPGQVKPEDAIVAALGALGETLTASFDNIDLNVNGLIDYTEFSRAFAGMASDATLQQIFSLLDANGDGTISRLEAIQGTSQQTADNTYGLDKLSRVKDVIDSLDWGTAGWDASSTRAFATVASQQGWTAQDVSQALNGRFTPEQLQQFFGQYGQNLALGGISGMGSATAGTGAAAGGTATGSGFVVGGGNAGASQGAPNYGSAGDIQTVFAQAYINSLDWGNPQVDASSTAALASYAGSAGLSQADLADLLGFTPEQIQQHFAAYGIPAFAVGTNYVPRDMLAMIHEGEAVVPKAYNPVAGGMDFSAFGRGMEAMAAEVRALREDNRAQARTVVSLLQRQVKLEERWDANGLPSTRVEA